MKFSNKLAYLRKTAGMSQDDFADKLEVSRQAVYKWESGLSHPDIDKLKIMAKMFKVSVDNLLDDDADIKYKPLKPKPVYGAVYKSAVEKIENINVETDNSILTKRQIYLINNRKKYLTLLTISWIVFLVPFVVEVISVIAGAGILAIIGAIVFGGLFVASLVGKRIVKEKYYPSIKVEREHFFKKQKTIIDYLEKRNYEYYQLQPDLLCYFFYDHKTSRFGYFFNSKEQFICPIQNYLGFSCTSNLDYAMAGGYKYMLTYLNEDGVREEYSYKLGINRNYEMELYAEYCDYDVHMIDGFKERRAKHTEEIATKISALLSAEKHRYLVNA